MEPLDILNGLKIGQRKIYMEATTEWTRLFKNRPLIEWCEKAIDSGNYVFTQALLKRDKMGIGTYFYICKRLK